MSAKSEALKFNIFEVYGCEHKYVVEYWVGDDNSSEDKLCKSKGEVVGVLAELVLRHFSPKD